MPLFSYHLVKLPFFLALRWMLFPLKPKSAEGLVHVETMSAMTLGSPIYSVSRFFNRDVIVFAQWRDEAAFNRFIQHDPFGKMLSKGWFVKLEFIRQWGTISGFQIPENREEELGDHDPVVAVTIARMKYSQIPRFLRWGRPVEKLVRDSPGTTLSLASIRYPNTISTFSIWKTQKEMTDMVRGHSKVPQPKRHIDAMEERNRKDFHFEFTTLRFRPLSESGVWKGKSQLVPKSQELK